MIDKRRREIEGCLADPIRQILEHTHGIWEDLQEIRLRVNSPLSLTINGKNYFISDCGRTADAASAHQVTHQEIRETVEHVSRYSRYAFEEQIRQGYLTAPGGHRVGICGRAVWEGDRLKTIFPITFMNIRVAREKKGCGIGTAEKLWENGQFLDTLILSPPGVGKTTLLRDLIRIHSYGAGVPACSVGVVDERCELAACYQGIPQNDLGPRTDVLDGCPKREGMMMLIRAMSPRILAVDEIGSPEDFEALEYAMNCGSGILATTHAKNVQEMNARPGFERWYREKRFRRYVVLERKENTIRIHVLDELGKEVV